MKLFRAVVLLVLIPPGAGTAYADSDGFYCIGRGYLAYQFGFAAPPVGPHRLFVIPFSGASGIQSPAVLDLPQFQVHSMLCSEGRIDIAAFANVYRVTLDNNNRPVGYEARPFPNGRKLPQEFILGQFDNLGALGAGRAYAKPVFLRLSARELGGAFFLEITAKVVPPLKNCELAVTSRIVETDRIGREISTRIIVQGRGHRECAHPERGEAPRNYRGSSHL